MGKIVPRPHGFSHGMRELLGIDEAGRDGGVHGKNTVCNHSILAVLLTKKGEAPCRRAIEEKTIAAARSRMRRGARKFGAQKKST